MKFIAGLFTGIVLASLFWAWLLVGVPKTGCFLG
jgi:hypothetical protein